LLICYAVGASLVFGTAVWVSGAYLSVKILKQLLRYKGFLYEGRHQGAVCVAGLMGTEKKKKP
jgi:hypothetical protein